MATILNVRDKLLQDPTVSRYSRAIQTFTQATQPWVNLVQTPADPNVQEVTKVVSGVVVNPAGNYATLFKPTAVTAVHAAGIHVLTNYVAYSSPNKVQLTGYFKDDGSDYRAQLVVNARTADSVTNRTLIYKFRPSTGIGSLVQTATGWSANSINVLAIGNGWWKVVVRGTFTTTASAESVINAEFDILNTSDASSFASVDTSKGLYIYGLQAYLGTQPDEMLGDTWIDTTNATSSRWNGYSWDSLGGSAVLTYLDATSPVIFKQAPDASTSGAHTNITLTGKKTTNGTTVTYGFLTVTGNGDTEATTATANTITTSIADTAGKTSYTVKLYNQATVAGATTLDTMVIPVVFKGATGSDGLTAILTNESHSIPTDSAGGSGNYTGSGTDIYVYEGSTQLAWDGSGTTAGKFTVSRSASNITAGGTIIANGNAARDPDHSGMTADVATVTYTITGKRANGTSFTITKVQSTSKSKAGVTGPTGTTGASSRTAYARIPSNPTAISTTKTVSGDNRPTSTESSTAWGASFNVSWTATDPSPGSSDSLYQIDGIYDPTANTTTWSSPYISSLKVGTLSAVTANTGNLNVTGNLTMSSSSAILGGQTAYNTGSGFFLGYSGAAYKFSIGSGSNMLTWDGTTLSVPYSIVTGTNRPADNAGAVITLVNSAGCTIVGNSVYRSSAYSGAWDAGAYSLDSYTQGISISFSPAQTTAAIAVGINSAPASSPGYTDMIFCWVLDGGAGAVPYGSYIGSPAVSTSYAAGDVFSIIYNGADVKFLKNGAVVYSTASYGTIGSSTALYLDVSIVHQNGKINNLVVVPVSNTHWNYIGGSGSGKPIDNAGRIVDGGSGSTVFGQRSRDDPPVDYPVGLTMQFKAMSALGLTATGNGWCTLETNKGYGDSSGVSVVQYAYDGAGTAYKRWGTANASSWGSAWVVDLDRNSYTGDLNATYGATFGTNISGLAQTSHIAPGAVSVLSRVDNSAVAIYSGTATSATGAVLTGTLSSFTTTTNPFRVAITGVLEFTCSATTQMRLRITINTQIYSSDNSTVLFSGNMNNGSLFAIDTTVGGDTVYHIPFTVDAVYPNSTALTRNIRVGANISSLNPTTGASVSNMTSIFLYGQVTSLELKV